ncbi:hypothetical protein AUR04nite_11340 [Glutamicibacter uratoxydans]|uniref:IS256 family transposase n=1 Tax=Glutamicibacter uratoxydans TaxID=43667 RepID=A0A4Y4DJY1_GLUUR|nr:IS1249 family transposase [Glutamicibacter uratoxydans]GED05602.1 hypothetical protein AUR04nite_11340 [Glutamicibacter uratoxydans]
MDVVPIGVTLNSKNTHLCSICDNPLKKNGKRNGKQRWRCTHCNASTTNQRRPDTKARNELTSLVSWITSKNNQTEHSNRSARTFRRNTAWCWNVTPHLNPTGEIFTEIQVDGIYLGSGWCCLIAIAHGKVIGWQWCDHEKAIAWQTLLSPLPPPRIVVTDGGSGLQKCLDTLWPEVRIQRCLVHVQRAVRQYLTLRPKTPAGKALRVLSLKLTRITSREQATEWIQLFTAWHTQYQHLLKERTYARDHTGLRPRGITSSRVWWYTHERLRKAYNAMNRPLLKGHLFAFLESEFEGLKINSTTNMIEGGINSGIRDMLRLHRGMPVEHRRRAVEWFCWTRADPASRPGLEQFITPELYAPAKHAEDLVDEAEDLGGPQLYGTEATAEEGLWARAGRAGHTGLIHC